MRLFEKVPALGQGTWEIEKHDRKQVIRALQRGIELGLTHIDTAEMYGDGKAEEIVGEAIRGRRQEVFLVSKLLPQNAAYARAIKSCEASLKRLGTDRLDVYLLHWREQHPLEDTFRAFDKLLSDGKIATWGVSNFDVADLEEAEQIAGPGKIACNQVLYNLWRRTAEHRVLPWCTEHDIAVVAYSPFEQRGMLELKPKQEAMLRELADAHQTTIRAVVLRFLIDHGTWTIPKAGHVEHVEENAKALTFRLTNDELKRLDSVFPRGKPGPLPVL